jgi:serine/threonine protein kinase
MQTFSAKLHSFNPAFYVSDDSPAGSFFSPLARDLFVKLCNIIPSERYTAEQALRHPWITRDLQSPIPLTQS